MSPVIRLSLSRGVPYLCLLVLVSGVLACRSSIGLRKPTPDAIATGQAFLQTQDAFLTREVPVTPTAVIIPTLTLMAQGTSLPGRDVSFGGVSFSSTDAIADGVSFEQVPEETPTGEGLPGDMYPEHIRFSFIDYTVQGSYHEPQIMVYPVEAYEAMDNYAADRIAELREILAMRPSEMPDVLPFLPMWPAAQLFSAKVGYIDFSQGTGLRYLTQHGQAAAPVNNHEVFYTYQGITGDGKTYIAAILPVNNAILPADGMAVPNDDWNAFSESYPEYTADMEQQLNAQIDDSFTPALSALDEMIKSLVVR